MTNRVRRCAICSDQGDHVTWATLRLCLPCAQKHAPEVLDPTETAHQHELRAAGAIERYRDRRAVALMLEQNNHSKQLTLPL